LPKKVLPPLPANKEIDFAFLRQATIPTAELGIDAALHKKRIFPDSGRCQEKRNAEKHAVPGQNIIHNDKKTSDECWYFGVVPALFWPRTVESSPYARFGSPSSLMRYGATRKKQSA